MEGIVAALGAGNVLSTGSRVYMFGKEYDPHVQTELVNFKADFKAILWMTYRKNFFPIKPAPFYCTSDAGWGCMLRSAQMILGQALQRHLGVDWRYQRKNHRELLRWFMDAPKVFSYYSIHRMLEFGRRYGKEAGQWYGPNTVALVLQDLVGAHRRVKTSDSNDEQRLEMVVAEGGTIYVDQIRKACEQSSENGEDPRSPHQSHKSDPLLRPGKDPVWSQALFLLVPVRLGLSGLNEEYIPALVEIMKFPQCIGMIGGKPAHSLYFVGVQEKSFFYLDPHTVQNAASDEAALKSDFPDAEETEKYHCESIKMMQVANIDPSLAVGFYCRTVKDFIDLRARIGQLNRVSPVFISVQDTRPVYSSISCEDADEGLETASEGRGEGCGGDDEFVLL